MADFSDIFGRVQGYQQRTQAGSQGIGGIGQYESRLQPVRQAYYERLERERQAALEAQARKWFAGASGPPMGGGGGGGGGAAWQPWAGGGGGGGSALNRFMAAISGQESGGDYNVVNKDSGAHGRFQIMPDNWGPWSRETFGKVVPKTPQNQDKVARYKMAQYYKQFGRWDLVARAWYAGPGSINYSQGALSRRQGRYPSINDYVLSVMRRMR